MNNSRLNYWRWFFFGIGARPGVRRLWNTWLIVHILVGTVLSIAVKGDLETTAKTVLLPLAGIFIGLSFAWAGNAQALLQSPEIEEVAKYHEGGFPEYVFVFQTAILTILVTLVLWGLAGLGIFDAHMPATKYPKVYAILKVVLFAFSSITLRECWHVVLGAQWMLLIQQELKSAGRSKGENEKRNPSN